ncbi:MAG: cytochrome c [Polaromonas sp.]
MKRQFFVLAGLLLSLSALAAPLNGKALYQENCASCHGAAGKGDSAPKLAGDASQWSTRLFERAVLTGVDDRGRALKIAMPHWKEGSFKSDDGSAPSKKEVVAIQHYLRAVK